MIPAYPNNLSLLIIAIGIYSIVEASKTPDDGKIKQLTT